MDDIRFQLLYSLYRDGDETVELLTKQCSIQVLHQLWKRHRDPLIGKLLARSIVYNSNRRCNLVTSILSNASGS